MLEGHKRCRVLFLKPYGLKNFRDTTNMTDETCIFAQQMLSAATETFSNLALCEQSVFFFSRPIQGKKIGFLLRIFFFFWDQFATKTQKF